VESRLVFHKAKRLLPSDVVLDVATRETSAFAHQLRAAKIKKMGKVGLAARDVTVRALDS